MCTANHQPANDKRERANRAETHVFDGSGNDGVSMSLRGNDSLVLNNLGAQIINRTSLLADLLLQFAMRGDHLLTGLGINAHRQFDAVRNYIQSLPPYSGEE